MTAHPRLGLIGPMLGLSPGGVPGQGEILAELFRRDGHAVRVASRFPGPAARVADTVWTLLAHRRSIDIVLVWVFSGRGFLLADLASWLAKRCLRRPVVLCLHGGGLPALARRRPRWTRRVLARADARVAPSDYLAEQLDLGLPIEVIPNVLETDGYPFRRRERVAPRLFWMRRFHDVYRPQLAVRVLAELRASRPDATLTLAGPDEGTLAATRRLAAELGVSGAVSFPGPLDEPAKRHQLDDHDIFLNTNRIDNMPVSLLEAGAAGLPVVTTAVGGIPYLWTDGETALLTPPDSSVAQVAGIRRLLDEPQLAGRLSDAGRRLAESFRWPQVGPRWQALFERLSPPSVVDRRSMPVAATSDRRVGRTSVEGDGRGDARRAASRETG